MTSTFLLITTKPDKEIEIANKLLGFSKVKDVNIVKGEYDIIVKVNEDQLTINDFIRNKLRSVNGIERINSLISTD